MSAGRFSDFDHQCMARALELARRALYTTDQTRVDHLGVLSGAERTIHERTS